MNNPRLLAHKFMWATLILGVTVLPLMAGCGTKATTGEKKKSGTATPIIITTTAAVEPTAIAHDGPTIGSCPSFPANNIWNYNISKLPASTTFEPYITKGIGSNTTLLTGFGQEAVRGFPYAIVSGVKSVPIAFNRKYYGGESDAGPYPIPKNVPREWGDPNNAENDWHVLVVDQHTCMLYEMWDSVPQQNGRWVVGGAAKWSLRSNQLRKKNWTSADAAGLPMTPLLTRYDEVASGTIHHALRIVVNKTQASFLWPARHSASEVNPPSTLPPMGLRLRLKSTVNINRYPRQSRVILTALRDYGMFVSDNGAVAGKAELSGAPDLEQNPQNLENTWNGLNRWDNNDLSSLAQIHLSDFDAVDESCLEARPDDATVTTNLSPGCTK